MVTVDGLKCQSYASASLNFLLRRNRFNDLKSLLWTHRESNPDLFHAMEPFYRYTMGPSEEQIESSLSLFLNDGPPTAFEYGPFAFNCYFIAL